MPCRHLDTAWSGEQVASQLKEFPHWAVEFSAHSAQPICLWRTYAFANFEGVKMAVHALMHLADDEDHHPDVHFGYNRLTVKWSTHSAGGVSDNDWACAAKLDDALRHVG
ncbi:4a-hydroxytetrahydrobiopterin dehydratase [Limnobacter humi]|uniref:4a-hydroxytetrahydrobiopterin dehydratase n=1 Tax=Limnobacter humi TaxID=1778671 RepID=A0ABT1WH94_9BURK|nr:4a-hydroxytetrahydrobiopterin dehydratase [Limnobacter humi]